MAKWIARWGERPRIFRWRPVSSHMSIWWQSSGTTSRRKTRQFFRRAARGYRQGLERVQGKSFFWAGKYSENLNERVTLATELNVFADFKPRLPERYRKVSKYVFLANIAPKLQHDVLQQVTKRPKIAALDTMNYWIERTNADLRETLKHVDILMINDTETRQLSNEHNLLRAARHIFKMGPSTLVVKRGEYGAMMVDARGVFCVPAFPLEEPHDPTGAGDCFAGGFMGYLASAGKQE